MLIQTNIKKTNRFVQTKSSPSLKRLKDPHNDIGTISFYSINILTLGTLHLEDNKVQKPK